MPATGRSSGSHLFKGQRSPPWQAGGEFYRQSGRGITCRNSTVIFKLVMSGLTSVILVTFNSFQSLSRVQLFATPWITTRQASLSITNSWSSLKLMSIESVMPSGHLILSLPLLLLPPIAPSIRVFSNESTLCMRWPKYWSFSFSISPSNEHPGLISFRLDWLDLLAVQGTCKSLLQHYSSKASIFFLLYSDAKAICIQ